MNISIEIAIYGGKLYTFFILLYSIFIKWFEVSLSVVLMIMSRYMYSNVLNDGIK